MHILLVIDNFPPEANASAIRAQAHARQWVQAGHTVTVLTCCPNFPKGQVYPNYRNRFYTRETIDGIQVVRVKTYITENKGVFKRIVDYMSFGCSAAFFGLFIKKPDVIIGSSPQPFAACAAWFLAKCKRVPFVFEVRDLWPQSILDLQAMKPGMLLTLFERVMHFLYKRAALVICVTEGIRARLIEMKVQPDKIKVIYNGASPTTLQPSCTRTEILERFQLPDKILIGHVGSLSNVYALKTILQAAKILQSNPRIHFVIMGAGIQADLIAGLAASCSNVSLLPPGSHIDAVNVCNALNYCVISHCVISRGKFGILKDALPTRMFEAMALRKPIFLGTEGESYRWVIEYAQAGVYFEPENPQDLARVINVTLSDPLCQPYGENGYQCFKEHFDRDKLALQMLNYLKDCR